MKVWWGNVGEGSPNPTIALHLGWKPSKRSQPRCRNASWFDTQPITSSCLFGSTYHGAAFHIFWNNSQPQHHSKFYHHRLWRHEVFWDLLDHWDEKLSRQPVAEEHIISTWGCAPYESCSTEPNLLHETSDCIVLPCQEGPKQTRLPQCPCLHRQTLWT